MSYNAIIFTNNIPEYKTTGAYCIASELRQNGYKTKIIDDTLYSNIRQLKYNTKLYTILQKFISKIDQIEFHLKQLQFYLIHL